MRHCHYRIPRYSCLPEKGVPSRKPVTHIAALSLASLCSCPRHAGLRAGHGRPQLSFLPCPSSLPPTLYSHLHWGCQAFLGVGFQVSVLGWRLGSDTASSHCVPPGDRVRLRTTDSLHSGLEGGGVSGVARWSRSFPHLSLIRILWGDTLRLGISCFSSNLGVYLFSYELSVFSKDF